MRDVEVSVSVHGFTNTFSAFSTESDIVSLHNQARRMNETLSGEVVLDPMEPSLVAKASIGGYQGQAPVVDAAT